MSTNELVSRATSGVSAASAYTDPPWWYDLRGFFIFKLAYRGSLLQMVSFFEKNLSDRHLEAAVGSGTLLRYILRWRRWHRRRRPEQIVGFDYSKRMLDGAHRNFRGWAVVELEHGDVTDLAYSDGSFDSVNVANAFHAFHEPEAALDELHRVLAPGGLLAMNVLLHPRGSFLSRRISGAICGWCIRKKILHATYAIDDVRGRLGAKGFRIETEWASGNSYYVLARKPQ